jgi:hypothetical protein
LKPKAVGWLFQGSDGVARYARHVIGDNGTLVSAAAAWKSRQYFMGNGADQENPFTLTYAYFLRSFFGLHDDFMTPKQREAHLFFILVRVNG